MHSLVVLLVSLWSQISLSLREEFYLTYTAGSGTECHSTISGFLKGIRCCHDPDESGGADTCTPYDENSNCFVDSSKKFSELSVTYEEAKQICRSRGEGYRLCTIHELSSLCLGTGCNIDNLEVWSNEGCVPVYKTSIRRPISAVDVTEGTAHGLIDSAAVRCCTLDEGSSTSKCVSEINGDCTYTIAGGTVTDYFSFTEATQICEQNGFRLCDIEVVKGFVDDQITTEEGNTQYGCGGSGCSIDYHYVWSRSTHSFDPKTWSPTAAPTQAPTSAPTRAPTRAPTTSPTSAPSYPPTHAPTFGPVETPVTPYAQLEADSDAMDPNCWDGVLRLKVAQLPTSNRKLNDGIHIRPDSHGLPALKFSKTGIYKVHINVESDDILPLEDLEMRYADELVVVSGAAVAVETSYQTYTSSTEFFGVVDDTDKLFVIAPKITSCTSNNVQYTVLLNWIADL